MNEKELQRISQQAALVGVNAGVVAETFKRVAEMATADRRSGGFIYKQDAIEAVDDANDSLVEDDYTYGVQSGMEKAKYVIEALPEVDEVEVLSEIRSRYNCFDPCERPVYHALSECIRAIKERREE